MMFDHLGFAVEDFAKSRAFYAAALAPLDARFWIGAGGAPTSRLQIAFAARSRGQAQAFCESAVTAGAKDNGPPGLRPSDHPNYYGAFVIDPSGHNIEAVCHSPEA
jgi:catechol 2,3-dioxygenase-like lactoylglutathione lyase family enzyme